jgi:hypothetical protein
MGGGGKVRWLATISPSSHHPINLFFSSTFYFVKLGRLVQTRLKTIIDVQIWQFDMIM